MIAEILCMVYFAVYCFLRNHFQTNNLHLLLSTSYTHTVQIFSVFLYYTSMFVTIVPQNTEHRKRHHTQNFT